MHSEELQKSEEDSPYFLPSPTTLRKGESLLWAPSAQGLVAAGGGCTLVKSCRRQAAFGAEPAAVPGAPGCAGQCQARAENIRFTQQGLGMAGTTPACRDSALMAGMPRCRALCERAKICRGHYLYFINFNKVGVLCLFFLRHQWSWLVIILGVFRKSSHIILVVIRSTLLICYVANRKLLITILDGHDCTVIRRAGNIPVEYSFGSSNV